MESQQSAKKHELESNNDVKTDMMNIQGESNLIGVSHDKIDMNNELKDNLLIENQSELTPFTVNNMDDFNIKMIDDELASIAAKRENTNKTTAIKMCRMPSDYRSRQQSAQLGERSSATFLNKNIK